MFLPRILYLLNVYILFLDGSSSLLLEDCILFSAACEGGLKVASLDGSSSLLLRKRILFSVAWKLFEDCLKVAWRLHLWMAAVLCCLKIATSSLLLEGCLKVASLDGSRSLCLGRCIPLFHYVRVYQSIDSWVFCIVAYLNSSFSTCVFCSVRENK